MSKAARWKYTESEDGEMRTDLTVTIRITKAQAEAWEQFAKDEGEAFSKKWLSGQLKDPGYWAWPEKVYHYASGGAAEDFFYNEEDLPF